MEVDDKTLISFSEARILFSIFMSKKLMRICLLKAPSSPLICSIEKAFLFKWQNILKRFKYPFSATLEKRIESQASKKFVEQDLVKALAGHN